MKTKLNHLFSSTIEKNLKKATNTDYHIVRVLGEGARTLAVLVADENGNLSVYKCNKKLSSLWGNISEHIKRWKKEGKTQAITNTNKMAENLMTTMETRNLFIQKLQNKARDHQNQVYVPKSTAFNGFSLEEYAGETTTYQLLSSKQSYELSKGLASFYATLHKTKSATSCKQSIFNKNCTHIKSILSNYKSCLPNDVIQQIKDTYNRLATSYPPDEINVPIHGDFRRTNLCYDSEKRRLAVIDWELADINNIYSEFLCKPICSQQLPYQFVSQLVDNYNKISQYKINKRKLKDLYYLTIVDEIGSEAIANDCTINDFCDYYLEALVLRLKVLDKEFILEDNSTPQLNI